MIHKISRVFFSVMEEVSASKYTTHDAHLIPSIVSVAFIFQFTQSEQNSNEFVASRATNHTFIAVVVLQLRRAHLSSIGYYLFKKVNLYCGLHVKID